MKHQLGRAPLVAAFVGIAGLAACGQNGTSCTSPAALAVTTKLITDQIEKDASAKYATIDTSVSPPVSNIRATVSLLKVSLDDIRTTKVDPNSTKRFCAATARVVFPLSYIQNADSARATQQLNTVSSLADASGVQRSADSFTFPIDFDVQPTDDKKDIFAESDSIDVQVQFLGEVLVYSLLNTKLQNQALAAQQAQQAQAQQQQLLAQQAEQATLDEAKASDQLTIQTINATWSGIDPDTRGQILQIQRAWIKAKDANCRIQAGSTSTDPLAIETARLNCDAAANQTRTEWLKQYLPKTDG